ncbi:hypothetical protein H0H92_002135 [Tricholoma furcatifolium]|nr:hypothetical protein H0H92_002135 [Tricholoma furcatifolium]
MILPPLPKIEGDIDLLLDVYTHRSLRFGGALNDDYGDTDRLAELGHRVLDLAVTFHYFSKRPMLSAEDITDHCRKALSDEKLDYWLNSYNLRSKLRFAPGEQDKIGSPEEIRRFFDTYVGALHIRNGNSTIQDWVSRLIDPEADHNSSSHWPPPIPVNNAPPTQSVWNPPPPPPLQPSIPPPPLPSGVPPMSIGVSSFQPVGPTKIGGPPVSLAQVHQTAAQLGVSVTYSAEQSGPPHLPTWTVKCFMSGIERGSGSGKSQKIAKEEAARQAWVRMNW